MKLVTSTFYGAGLRAIYLWIVNPGGGGELLGETGINWTAWRYMGQEVRGEGKVSVPSGNA
jgi:hypothetical protein